MKRPDYLTRPRTPIAPAIHCMEDDTRTLLGKLMTQMRIGHGRTARIRPKIITDQAADADSVHRKRPQGRRCIIIDLALRLLCHRPTTQDLAVKALIDASPIIE